MRLIIGTLIAISFLLGTDGRSEIVWESPPTTEKVRLCALQADPAAYNHNMIDVRAVVSHGFDDLTLSDPQCPPRSGIWLEYGGLVNSETVTFRAHLIGRFFAGLKQHTPKGDFWGGYGHLGCCSLLVIQQVLAVEAKDDASVVEELQRIEQRRATTWQAGDCVAWA